MSTKRSLSVIAALLLFHLICFNQTLIQESSFKLSKKAGIKVAGTINSNDIYFSFLDVGALHRFYLNTADGSILKLKQPVNENFLPSDDKSIILYSFSEKGKTINVIHDDFSKKIYAEEVDFIKKEVRPITHFISKKEMFIGADVAEGAFYLVSREKGTNVLRFFIRTADGTFFAREFDLSYFIPPGEDKLSEGIWNKCKVVHSTSMDDPQVLAARIKIYITPQFIRITADNYFHYTRMLEISLPDYTVKKDGFTQIRLNSKTLNTPITSSALLRNYLVQAAAYPDTLKIRFVELGEKKVIREFGISKDDTISFKNSPIYQEGGGTFFSTSREIELKNTSQLLRKITGAELAIGITELGSKKVEMIVGSFKEVTSPSAMQFGFNASGLASFGFGNFTTWSKSSYFRSLLDQETFTHLREDLLINIKDQTKNENPFPKAEKKIELISYNRRIFVIYENEKLSVYSSEAFPVK